jgi:adenosylhomocysteine nucleosidase
LGSRPLPEFNRQQREVGDLGHVKPLLVVVGLRVEARIAAGPQARVVIGGSDRVWLTQAIDSAIGKGSSGVMSFGLAGGLAPHLRPGAIVIAGCVLAGGERIEADAAWSQSLVAVLSGAVIADMAGVDRPIATASAKQQLYAATGAAAVDMESHIAARAAGRHGLPFIAVRVVADPADCDLPPAALVAMSPDGTIDTAAVLRSLLQYPGQLPALVRTAIHTAAALGALRSARRNMGAFLAHHNHLYGN